MGEKPLETLGTLCKQMFPPTVGTCKPGEMLNETTGECASIKDNLWSDFESCEAEKKGGACWDGKDPNVKLDVFCGKTCDVQSKPCPSGKVKHELTNECVTPPWTDFESCDAEKKQGACWEGADPNPDVDQMCYKTCNTKGKACPSGQMRNETTGMCVPVPWEDFQSCDVEKQQGACWDGNDPNADVDTICAVTCNTKDKPCPRGQMKNELLGTCVPIPWDDFVSCDKEKEQGACWNGSDPNPKIDDLCYVTCNTASKELAAVQ